MLGIDAADGIGVLGWLGGIAKAHGDYGGVGFWDGVYATNTANTDASADSDTAHDACLDSIATDLETYPNSIATDSSARLNSTVAAPNVSLNPSIPSQSPAPLQEPKTMEDLRSGKSDES